MKLETTNNELHTLEQIEDGARASSTTVKVPREALRHLLRDHYTLNTEVLRKHGQLPETVND
jgi:hypothetical protein